MINTYLLFEDAKTSLLTEAKSSVKLAKQCVKIINKDIKPLLNKQLKLVKDNNKKALKLTASIIEVLMKVENVIINIVEDMHSKTIDVDELDNYMKHIQYVLDSYINSYSSIAQDQIDNTYSKKVFKDIFKNKGTIWGNMLRNTIKHIGDKGKEIVSRDTLAGKANIHKTLTNLFTSVIDVLKAVNILEVILNQYINKQG